MFSVNHELPSTGFATSTVFTLGTDNGIILICMHTNNNQLHFFGTFIQHGHFDIQFHWTTWRPRETLDTIDIDHEAVVVPVDNEEPILRIPVEYERFPFAPHPPQYHPRNPTSYVIPASTTSKSSSNETASAPEEPEETPLHITNPDPPTPTEETEDDNQSEAYTDTRLLDPDHHLHIAQEEA